MSRPGHLGRIVFGYALSCLPPAGWFAFTIAHTNYYSHPLPWQIVATNFLIDLSGLAAIVALWMALPAIAAIWLAERRQWRSITPYAVLGACAPVLVFLLLYLVSSLCGEVRQTPELSFFTSTAFEFGLLGLISGSTYWAAAGRRSGWSGT